MASSWAGYGPSAPHPSQPQPSQPSNDSGASKKKPQPRQLLSCTKCRERKVKCDRTIPCAACCARGHPKECQFIVGDGNDYSPIQQSYEIKDLRRENQRLREQLRDARAKQSTGDDDDVESPDRSSGKTTSRAAAAKQRRFRTNERIDNIYFGTPGLANIVSDFANLQIGNHSLTHTVPKGQDIYPAQGLQYPFHIIPIGDNSAAALTDLLPSNDEEIFGHLDLFQKQAQSCSFPHFSDEMTKKEVERFLEDRKTNATKAPDMLALLFATLAVGVQIGVHDRNGRRWLEAPMEEAHGASECYLGASMQALRHASFMSQPTLLGIQTLVMMGPYLTNSGRFLDAWTLFGTTIRLAHSIGLHRDPRFLDPVPPLRECLIRRTLWWWMLHMDQQYSVTLGRPLGISGIGDCPPPESLTTNQTVLRLGEFVNHFTILARQILSSDGLMSVSRIDEFTDKLLGLWDTMPESLQFNESWAQKETKRPEWPLDVMSATLFAKVQSFIILLNRQRDERTMRSTSSTSPPSYPNALTGMSGTASTTGGDSILHQAPIRGRPLVINSSIHLLQTFLFFYHIHPAVLICWTIGQQAFNAAMIIILDAWETGNIQNMWLVNEALAVFSELQKNGVHKIAALAVSRITEGIIRIETRQQERQDAAASAAAAANTAAMSRQSSQQQHQHPPQRQNSIQASPPVPTYHLYQPNLALDTTGVNLLDIAGDTVMGNTGMFLLEDPGLQSQIPGAQLFAPWGLSLPASAAASSPYSSSATSPITTHVPGQYSPPVPHSVPDYSPECQPPAGRNNKGISISTFPGQTPWQQPQPHSNNTPPTQCLLTSNILNKRRSLPGTDTHLTKPKPPGEAAQAKGKETDPTGRLRPGVEVAETADSMIVSLIDVGNQKAHHSPPTTKKKYMIMIS
ncbi:hypothetical protein Q7P37_004493 [Cladosporium fusiforme]